jgi:hypothetical protein
MLGRNLLDRVLNEAHQGRVLGDGWKGGLYVCFSEDALDFFWYETRQAAPFKFSRNTLAVFCFGHLGDTKTITGRPCESKARKIVRPGGLFAKGRIGSPSRLLHNPVRLPNHL